MESRMEKSHSSSSFLSFIPLPSSSNGFSFARQEDPILTHALLLAPPVLLAPSSFVTHSSWSFPANSKYSCVLLLQECSSSYLLS